MNEKIEEIIDILNIILKTLDQDTLEEIREKVIFNQYSTIEEELERELYKRSF